MSKTETEYNAQRVRETVAERAARFKKRKVKIYERGKLEPVEVREMDFTEALKLGIERREAQKGGIIIEGLQAWVDIHKDQLRIKPRVIEDVQATEGLSRNIIAWANYNDFVRLVAAKDLHIDFGLWVYEDEEFWYPRVLSRWAPTTKKEAIHLPNMWGTGFPAYTADGQPVEFPVRSKKVSAYPWEGSR
jgi:hypothetical protein